MSRAGVIDRKKAAYFFDFDGVILDSAVIKTSAFEVLFKSYDDHVVSRVLEHHRQNGGISRIDKIQYSHEHFIGKPLTSRELSEWNSRYSQLVVDQVVNADWIAGAREFLEEMHEQVPIFVISGTPETELIQVINRRNMAHYFREMRGSPTRKPAHILDLVGKYRLVPEDCVFVGDALTDYHSAQETGLHFVGIQGEVHFPDGTVVLPDCRRLKETVLEMIL